jgi:hypothetical protein
MADAARWDERYRHGDTPWESGQPSSEQRVLAEVAIRPCRALELGCGTGASAVWLAQQAELPSGLSRFTAPATVRVSAIAARKKLRPARRRLFLSAAESAPGFAGPGPEPVASMVA